MASESTSGGNALSTPRSLLTSTKLQAIRPDPQTPVVLRFDCTVDHALKVLSSQQILSAPVVACSEEDTPDDCTDVIGFIDIRDVLLSFLSDLSMSSMKGHSMLQCMHALEAAGKSFGAKKLQELPELGGDGTFLLDTGMAKVSVMELVHNGFLYPRETKAVHNGEHSRTVVHRVGLFNKAGHITNIISQSDVVRWLQHQQASLGNLRHMTAQQLGWADKQITSVPAKTPAIECLDLMRRSNFSAVAITDSTVGNRLIGNFSVSDLRSIESEHFGSLALPVGEFLALEHGLEYWGISDHEQVQASPAAVFAHKRKQERQPGPGDSVGQSLVTCTPQDTFSTIIDSIVEHHLHRVYVVNDQGQAVGVVTLTDLLRKVTEEAQNG
ncbi:hypothetical protein ABBQ32_013075 [Trebouxia sp. C0010 RCD-2024]